MSNSIYPKNPDHRTKFYQSSLEAGGGKSHTTYSQIAKTGNKTIIVIPRIDLIEEQVKLFNGNAIVVHSRDTNPSSVVEKIADSIHIIQAENNDKHVLIITHNGFIQYTRWNEIDPVWDLVIDEYMKYYQLIGLPVKWHSDDDRFWDLFQLQEAKDGLSEVEFSAKAKTIFKEKSDFTIESESFKSLYRLTANNWLMIRPEKWGKPTASISFAALLNFNILENFTTVKFLADGFVNSPIAKYLTIGYGITFEDLNIKEYRPRSLSLPERITIYQLSERDISNFLMQQLTPQHYSEIDIAINQIANSQDTIWTTNQRYREQFNIRGTYLTPRQSGTNEYSDKTTAVWLASMKTHSMDVKTAMLVAGFNQQTLTTIQELEPLHQFITRTNIRKFDDDTKTNVIVFGPQQADCLAKRYGISKDAIVHLNVELPEKGKPGRKPKPKPKPRKKRKPGRKPSPLPKAERERWRRYLKKVNAGKAPDPINNAWFVNAAKTLGKYEDRFSDLPR